MSALQEIAERAIEVARQEAQQRGVEYHHGPWWRHQMFDIVRLEDAKESGCTCAVCGTDKIEDSWGVRWRAPVAWGCGRCLARFNVLVERDDVLAGYRAILSSEASAARSTRRTPSGDA